MLSPNSVADMPAIGQQPQPSAPQSASPQISAQPFRFQSVQQIDDIERKYPNMSEASRKLLERERTRILSQSRKLTKEEKLAVELDPDLPWYVDEKGNKSLPQGFTRGDFKSTDIVDDATGDKRTIFTNDRNQVRFPNEMDPRLGGSARNPYSVGNKSTEAQSKDALYANRMFQAAKIIDDPKNTEAMKSLAERGAGSVPVAGNYMVSKEFQMASQAQRDFINATLRRESGAVISEPEFSNAKQQYFPQPGDSKEVLAQKKRNRAEAIKGIAGGAGPQYTPPFDISADGSIVERGKKGEDGWIEVEPGVRIRKRQ
jgi:hypothetical protein